MEQLETPSLYESVVQRHTPRILKIFNSPATAHFVSQPEEVWSALEITAPDRPGLLALIGQFFMNNNIMLHKAKIATLGERVEDTFYITEENGDLITDEESMNKICTLLKRENRPFFSSDGLKTMNPLIHSLHPYPFQKLAELIEGITPNPAKPLIKLTIGEPQHESPRDCS